MRNEGRARSEEHVPLPLVPAGAVNNVFTISENFDHVDASNLSSVSSFTTTNTAVFTPTNTVCLNTHNNAKHMHNNDNNATNLALSTSAAAVAASHPPFPTPPSMSEKQWIEEEESSESSYDSDGSMSAEPLRESDSSSRRCLHHKTPSNFNVNEALWSQMEAYLQASTAHREAARELTQLYHGHLNDCAQIGSNSRTPAFLLMMERISEHEVELRGKVAEEERALFSLRRRLLDAQRADTSEISRSSRRSPSSHFQKEYSPASSFRHASSLSISRTPSSPSHAFTSATSPSSSSRVFSSAPLSSSSTNNSTSAFSSSPRQSSASKSVTSPSHVVPSPKGADFDDQTVRPLSRSPSSSSCTPCRAASTTSPIIANNQLSRSPRSRDSHESALDSSMIDNNDENSAAATVFVPSKRSYAPSNPRKSISSASSLASSLASSSPTLFYSRSNPICRSHPTLAPTVSSAPKLSFARQPPFRQSDHSKLKTTEIAVLKPHQSMSTSSPLSSSSSSSTIEAFVSLSGSSAPTAHTTSKNLASPHSQSIPPYYSTNGSNIDSFADAPASSVAASAAFVTSPPSRISFPLQPQTPASSCSSPSAAASTSKYYIDACSPVSQSSNVRSPLASETPPDRYRFNTPASSLCTPSQLLTPEQPTPKETPSAPYIQKTEEEQVVFRMWEQEKVGAEEEKAEEQTQVDESFNFASRLAKLQSEFQRRPNPGSRPLRYKQSLSLILEQPEPQNSEPESLSESKPHLARPLYPEF